MVDIIEYEPPVLLDLEDVVAGDCGICITGGGAANLR